VQNGTSGEVIYTLRINGDSFTPLVREAGVYKVIAYDPDGDYYREWPGIAARKRTSP
jgi:hypothetical protein